MVVVALAVTAMTGCERELGVYTLCQYEDGSYNPMGLQAFHWVQGKFHIVLGHYKSYSTSQLEPLTGFALDLLAGVPIQTAYFDVDPHFNTSAIAAENFEFPGWPASTMVNDAWDDAGPDHEDTSIFTQRWITPVGTVAEHWD